MNDLACVLPAGMRNPVGPGVQRPTGADFSGRAGRPPALPNDRLGFGSLPDDPIQQTLCFSPYGYFTNSSATRPDATRRSQTSTRLGTIPRASVLSARPTPN